MKRLRPLNLTIFPVATPSPCAAASAGGYTCTLNVTAPIGNDNFFVAAFATASPNANAVPLSEYIALGITVSASSGTTPITFTLDGVVYKVQLSVPSPDPGNTPFTQVVPAGVAAGPLPLEITAYDSSNTPILTNVTNTFANPIVIGSPSPGGDGVSLSLSGATCSTIANGAVSIGCAADLNHVQFSVDGTPRPDASDHIIDTFTIATTTQQGNPTPSPAHVVLSSNVLSWGLGLNDNQIYNGQLVRNPTTGQLVYIAADGEGNNYVGTFDPSTLTVGSYGSLTADVGYAAGFALDSSGTFWLADSGQGVLDCWPSVTSAVSGAAPTVVDIVPYTPGGDEIYVTSVAVDAANNIWYVGYDSGECEDCGLRHRNLIPSTSPDYSYAGYLPATACNDTVNTAPTATAYLTNDKYDYVPFIAPLNSASGDGVFVSSYTGSGTYVITTSSTTVNPVTSQLGGGDADSYGAAVDGAGTAYAAFLSEPSADIESMPVSGSAFSTLLGLPPTTSGSFPSPEPWGIDAFSPTGGAADRIDYADEDYEALGLVEDVPASPMPLLATVPNADYTLWATHSSQGGEYMLYLDNSGNLDLARVIPTTTWSVPVAQLGALECGGDYFLLSIVERGNSAPFNVSYSPAAESSTALPGSAHNYWLETTGNFTATVTDNNGRTESYPIAVSTFPPEECGAAHRPLRHGPRVLPHLMGKRTP